MEERKNKEKREYVEVGVSEKRWSNSQRKSQRQSVKLKQKRAPFLKNYKTLSRKLKVEF